MKVAAQKNDPGIFGINTHIPPIARFYCVFSAFSPHFPAFTAIYTSNAPIQYDYPPSYFYTILVLFSILLRCILLRTGKIWILTQFRILQNVFLGGESDVQLVRNRVRP